VAFPLPTSHLFPEALLRMARNTPGFNAHERLPVRLPVSMDLPRNTFGVPDAQAMPRGLEEPQEFATSAELERLTREEAEALERQKAGIRAQAGSRPGKAPSGVPRPGTAGVAALGGFLLELLKKGAGKKALDAFMQSYQQTQMRQFEDEERQRQADVVRYAAESEMAALDRQRALMLRKEEKDRLENLAEKQLARQKLTTDEQRRWRDRFYAATNLGELDTAYRNLQGTPFAVTRGEYDKAVDQMVRPVVTEFNARAVKLLSEMDVDDPDAGRWLEALRTEREGIQQEYPRARLLPIEDLPTLRKKRMEEQARQFDLRRKDQERRFQALFKQRGEHFYKSLAVRWAGVDVARQNAVVNAARGNLQAANFFLEKFDTGSNELGVQLGKDLLKMQAERAKLVTAAARAVGKSAADMTPEGAKAALAFAGMSKRGVLVDKAALTALEPLKKLLDLDDRIKGVQDAVDELGEQRGAMGLPMIDLDEIARGNVGGQAKGNPASMEADRQRSLKALERVVDMFRADPQKILQAQREIKAAFKRKYGVDLAG
jgi:hypothetical protein